MEVINWLKGITSYYNWFIVIIIIIFIINIYNIIKRHFKLSLEKERVKQLNKSVAGLSSKCDNQSKIITKQTKTISEYYKIDNLLRTEIIKFNDTLEYITTMPIGVKANNFTYKSFIYKKEKGAFAESKKNGKITLVKGELGYIINDSFFLSLKNFEAKLGDVNLRIQEIIDNTNNEIDYDTLFTFQVEGLRSSQVVALA